MSIIQRRFMAHFINTAHPGADAVYERLGKDLTDYDARMGAQVQTTHNILGQTNVIISGYEKTASVDTYYAREGSALFQRLQRIVEDELVLDDLKTDVVEVKLWDGSESGFLATRQEAYIEVLSYGGDTTGYQIPFKLHFTGEKAVGKFNVTTQSFT